MGRGHTVQVAGEWVDGYLVGKAAAMAEYAWKREKREFAALCMRLYRRNWARRWRQLNPERARSIYRRWQANHREQIRASDRARRVRRRAMNPILCCCAQCSQSWEITRGRRSRFCSRHCRNAWHSRRRSIGPRVAPIVVAIIDHLRDHPWSTKAQIWASAPWLSGAGLSVRLYEMARAGRLSRRGSRKRMEYSLSD